MVFKVNLKNIIMWSTKQTISKSINYKLEDENCLLMLIKFFYESNLDDNYAFNIAMRNQPSLMYVNKLIDLTTLMDIFLLHTKDVEGSTNLLT
jgi:hypothetical protein